MHTIYVHVSQMLEKDLKDEEQQIHKDIELSKIALVDRQREREDRESQREKEWEEEREQRQEELDAVGASAEAGEREREREKAARAEAREVEKMLREREREDEQEQQHVMRVCADMLGRELAETEEENSFLKREIKLVESALKAAFNERVIEREAWAQQREMDVVREQARCVCARAHAMAAPVYVRACVRMLQIVCVYA